jgi:hypothetical protein
MYKRVERLLIYEGPPEEVDQQIARLSPRLPGESKKSLGNPNVQITCYSHKEFLVVTEEELRERNA